MGRKYHDQLLGVDVNTATLSSAVTNLQSGANFLTYGTSGVANDAILPNISFIGQQVSVVIDNNTTSLEANINTNATGDVFWGSTNNTITLAGATAQDALFSLELTAVTTSAWAVTGLSSTGHWSFSASTGSTGQ